MALRDAPVWWPEPRVDDTLLTVMSPTDRADLEERLRQAGRYGDTTTPADGHCLFHALRKEGATKMGHMDLRGWLFADASTEDGGALATAAVLVHRSDGTGGNSPGMPRYVSRGYGLRWSS